jgi:osmoprotectant transport system ATP-binding protein
MIELSGGDILLDGESVRKRHPAELRRRIGYVIQQIGLFPHLTIGENIGVVPKLLGWNRARTARRIEELLELVSLPQEMRDRYPSQLSGGQRQRIGVARALAADPPLMLMDEPFGAVDPINRERLQNQFLRLQSEIRKTILFVTHDIDEAIKMGDRVAVLEKGGVLAQYATPSELLMNPASEFVEDFVGADRALKRLSLLRVRDIDLWKAPLARVGEPTANVRAAVPGADLPHPLVVDADGRPLGWLSERDLAGETVPARPDTSADPVVELDDVLRDALSDLLRSDSQYGPVVDEHGRVAGVLSVEIVSQFLSSPRAAEQATPAAERVTS